MRLRWILQGLLLAGLIAGCGRSAKDQQAAADAANQAVEKTEKKAVETNRDADLKKLRSREPREQQIAAESLGKLAATDPTVIPALLEALKEKSNRGAGQVFPLEPNSVRDAAVQALLNAGPSGESALADKGLPVLLEGLKDTNPAVREHSAVAIGRMGKKGLRAADPLWALAGDSDTNVRSAALDALQQIAPPSPLPVLLLLIHEDEGVRRDAATALNWLRPLPATAAEGLTEALKRDDPFVRSAVADALVDLGPAAKPALPGLLELLKAQAALLTRQPEESLAIGPLQALVGIGEDAVEPVAKLLESPDPLVRWQAAYVLGDLGPKAKAATPAIEKATQDRQGLVALEAARALTRCTGDAKKSTDLFSMALNHTDPGVRAVALQVVARTGSEGRSLSNLVFPLIADEDVRVRRAAVEYVTSLDKPTAKPAVPLLAKRLVDDDNDQVRQRAAEVLEDFGPDAAGAAEALGKAVAQDADTDVRKAALATLTVLGPAAKPGLPGITQLAGDAKADPLVRAEALLSLAQLDPNQASVTLLTATADKSPEVRKAAVVAFGKVPSPSAEIVKKLADVASTDRDFAVRNAALKSLTEIGPGAKSVRETVAKFTSATARDQALWANVILARIDGKSADAFTAARAGLTSRFPAERLAACEALSVIGNPDPKDLTALIALTKDRASEVRGAAALTIARYGRNGKSAIPRLTELMKDRDVEVRTSAAVALGQVGDQSLTVLNPLRRAVRSDPLVRRTAHRSLRQLGVSDSE